MTQAAKKIVSAAIQLSESDRVQIVEELLASLEPASDEDVDAAWVAEVERRSTEIKERTVRTIPWDKVKSRVRERVRGGS
jgi:putative addiction module component (TIGR02574 family)